LSLAGKEFNALPAAVRSRQDIRFEIRFTYEFIRRFLPHGCKRILEIGCGGGELAAALARDGFAITAIDRDQEQIAAARSLGVDARLVEWPDFDDGSFDAVLFMRSLHHIHPLHQAVRRAVDCLSPGGRLIVEDFSYEAADEKTLRWFTGVCRVLSAAGMLTAPDEFLVGILSSGVSVSGWRKNYEEHDLSTGVAMKTALDEIAGRVQTENAPYYFRYLVKALASSNRRDAIIQALATQELTLIDDGAIVALGRRFVVTRES
jgi:SAM-dependent methyltransferase